MTDTDMLLAKLVGTLKTWRCPICKRKIVTIWHTEGYDSGLGTNWDIEASGCPDCTFAGRDAYDGVRPFWRYLD